MACSSSRSLASVTILDRIWKKTLTHGGDDGDHEVLASLEVGHNLLTNLGLGDLDVVLGTTVRVHQVEETVLDIKELEFLPPDVRDVHVVGGGRNVFELLAGEDLIRLRSASKPDYAASRCPLKKTHVDGDKVNLGVTVLTSLGSGHVNDLARPALDDNVTVLPESGTLHTVGQMIKRIRLASASCDQS